MGLGIWGGVAVVAGIVAAIAALLVWSIGAVATMAVGFILVCVLMMLVILAQKPRGGGLAGAFGGAGGGSSQTAFGAKTGDVMTWSTIVLFVCFLALAMGLTWATLPGGLGSRDGVVPVTATDPHAGHNHAPGEGHDHEHDHAPAAPVMPATPATTPAAPAESQP